MKIIHHFHVAANIETFLRVLLQMILPIAVEDVKREVKILQALSGHENVVQFHNAYEDSSYVYIVMEYVSIKLNLLRNFGFTSNANLSELILVLNFSGYARVVSCWIGF